MSEVVSLGPSLITSLGNFLHLFWSLVYMDRITFITLIRWISDTSQMYHLDPSRRTITYRCIRTHVLLSYVIIVNESEEFSLRR